MRISSHGKKQGFTLLELSVSLVVIGLLAGGVIVGRTLIRSAQIRETLGQYSNYVQAVKEFQDKYQALPGDFNRATSIWGAQAGTTATGLDASCIAVASDTTFRTLTCNGNGDGRIGAIADATTGIPSQQYEWWRFWQHLANAGFIDGKFTGVKGTGGLGAAKVGYNIPAGKLKGAGWTMLYFQLSTTNAAYWADNYGHILYLGAETADDAGAHWGGSTVGAPAFGPVLTPYEAYDIDNKIDDGAPGTGIVRARRVGTGDGVAFNCTVSDTIQAAAQYSYFKDGSPGVADPAYSTTNNKNQCSLFFVPGF